LRPHRNAQQLAAGDRYQFQWWALGLVGARPVEEKKGADKSIDGKILLRETPTDAKARQIIFSVKGGGVGVMSAKVPYRSAHHARTTNQANGAGSCRRRFLREQNVAEEIIPSASCELWPNYSKAKQSSVRQRWRSMRRSRKRRKRR
jgi:hypothetical protein